MALTGLKTVLERIDTAARRSGRSPDDVKLVAVSKGRSDALVAAAYREGHRVFGENRQQGLAGRIGSDLPKDIEWHFIGPLQGRKAPFVAAHVSLLHSFDRFDLIRRWSATSTPVLIQFNMAGESQKSGFAPAEAKRALETILGAGILVKGVMAIPPATESRDETRGWFAELKKIFDIFNESSEAIDTLSMGMSSDFDIAVEEGATLVRVGTAIFGPVQHDFDRNG
jgi:pyridoxal phosphate enzyme (YggS family)